MHAGILVGCMSIGMTMKMAATGFAFCVCVHECVHADMCIKLKMALGITKKQQWEAYASCYSKEKWDDVEIVATKLRRYQLEWLRYVATVVDSL